MADIDEIDLWVQSRDLTDEDREAIQRAIQEYREQHPISDLEREAIRVRLLEKFGIEVRGPKSAGVLTERAQTQSITMIFNELLERFETENTLVDIRRDEMNVGDLRGFILDFSEKLILIAVAGNNIQPNGYALIDQKDITFFRSSCDYLLAWERLLKDLAWERLLKDSESDVSIPRSVDLSDWPSAIRSLGGDARLLTFHRERLDSSTCYIARNVEVSDDLVIANQITPEGTANGRIAFRIANLTRLDFGGEYERGLQRMLDSVTS